MHWYGLSFSFAAESQLPEKFWEIFDFTVSSCCLCLVQCQQLENNGLELLTQNLNRLDEKVNEESTAIHNTLGIFEVSQSEM
jgi:hypothetical protein